MDGESMRWINGESARRVDLVDGERRARVALCVQPTAFSMVF